MNIKNCFGIVTLTVLSTMVLSSTFVLQTMAQTQATPIQNNNANFSEFLRCLLDNDSNGTISPHEIDFALTDEDIVPTEQEIRDCFAPIYNAESDDEDNDETDEVDENEENAVDEN